jgi:OmpA-OmpF porin, OOP family
MAYSSGNKRTAGLIKFAGAASLVALLGASNVASAEGFYAGGSVGQTDYDGISDNPTGFKIFGGMNFNKNLGVEVTYYDFGEAKESGVTVEADGIGVTANGYIPLTNDFSLFGKVGLLMWDVDTNVGVSDDGTDLLYGIGVKWDLNKQLALRAEYEVADFDGDDGSLLSVGFSFKF